jgi:hypothetical protein
MLDLHVVRVEAEEVLMKVETETHVLVGVHIHVVMVRVVLLSVLADTLNQQAVNQVGISCHLIKL